MILFISERRDVNYFEGKSFRQQRPEGLLVSHEHILAFVSRVTKALISGLRSASFLVMPKQ